MLETVIFLNKWRGLSSKSWEARPFRIQEVGLSCLGDQSVGTDEQTQGGVRGDLGWFFFVWLNKWVVVPSTDGDHRERTTKSSEPLAWVPDMFWVVGL